MKHVIIHLIVFCTAQWSILEAQTIAITILGKYAFRLLDDYRQQKRRGIQEPTFHRSQLPEIAPDLDCWDYSSPTHTKSHGPHHASRGILFRFDGPAGKLIFNLLIDKVARCASIVTTTSWAGAGRPVRPERIPRSHYPRALPTADSPFPRTSWRKSARPNHSARAR